jgi:hypothetical protein
VIFVGLITLKIRNKDFPNSSIIDLVHFVGVHVSDYGKNNVDEVIDFLKENPLLMSFFFIDTAIDYENRKFPLPSYINYVTKDIDFDYLKKSEIFLSSLEFTNDENFFFNIQSVKKKYYV